MAGNVKTSKRSMTKKDRSKAKGTMSRKRVSVKNSGGGSATVAYAGKKRKK